MGTCLIIKSGGGTDTSNATATADKILSGYTIYSNDDKITGSMFNVGNQCKTDTTWGNTSGTYTFVPGTVGGVWGGYHDGTCVMQAAALESQTQCDIPNQWWCLTGYSYWANGSKYDGAMVNRGAKTWSIGANGSQTIEDGWHDGNGYVNQSIPIDDTEWGSGGATTDIKICWEGFYYTKNRWCYGAGTLVPWNIKSGVTIYGVSGTYYETARWIIQNGSPTGLVPIRWAGSGLSTSNTINNQKYTLISGSSASWGGKEDGYDTNWSIAAKFGSIANIVKLSYTSNGSGAASSGFNIRGDFLTYYWWSRSTGSYTVYFEVGFFFTDNLYYWWRTPESQSVSTGYQSFSIPSTNVTSYTGNRPWDYDSNGGPTGALALVSRRTGMSLNASYRTELWCKNLWLDTSVTVTKAAGR